MYISAMFLHLSHTYARLECFNFLKELEEDFRRKSSAIKNALKHGYTQKNESS